MFFEFFPIIDGIFSIGVVVILIALFGHMLLRVLGLSRAGTDLGPISFIAGLILVGVLYLSLPAIKKAGLIPDFLSLEFFAWLFVIVFFILPVFLVVVTVVYVVLASIGNFIVDRLMPKGNEDTPWFLIIVFVLPPVLIVIVAFVFPFLGVFLR